MGPWGTTFPINVRLFASEMSEGQWLEQIKKFATRPPMPWYDLRAMTDEDLIAVYRFINSFGPAALHAWTGG